MLEFHEIELVNDPLLVPWLELYETAFPPEERILVSSFLAVLHEKANGNYPDSHMQAVTDDERFVALLRYDLVKERGAAYLWYIAVQPDTRGGGIGSACFSEVVRLATEAGLPAVVFEVEIPGETEEPLRRECAARRIEFYRRLGCRTLGGINYIQRIRNQPELPMHIMVRPIREVTPRQVFEMANALLGGVEQTGKLELF